MHYIMIFTVAFGLWSLNQSGVFDETLTIAQEIAAAMTPIEN